MTITSFATFNSIPFFKIKFFNNKSFRLVRIILNRTAVWRRRHDIFAAFTEYSQ
ncbi:Uncharacterized protein APZ42_016688 [Daphnia magna]|uniref:Uncharacterized protein n=1 Tax=Daphnia magna TaxID=35525 RepID=A0A165A2W1_9CRUS|nr:Uncharacterized protein APZ42_016688 [Daphnia magna]